MFETSIRVMRGLDLKFGKQAIIVVDEEVALDEHRTRCIVRNPESSRQTYMSVTIVCFLGCAREPGHPQPLNQPSSCGLNRSHYVLLA